MLDLIKKIWHDPVWSKVIATGVIAIAAGATAIVAASFRQILTSRIPLWALLATLAIIALLLPYWWRAIRRKKPELHLAWHGSAGWGIGGILQKDGEMERVLRIQGLAVISSSFLEEPLVITGIDLKDAEYAGPYFLMFELKPGETIQHTFLLNFRSVTPAQGRPFTANLTLIDVKGQRYPLESATLRAFPGPQLSLKEPTAQPSEANSFAIDSPDKFSLRFNKVDSSGIRGIELQVENNRLTSIHQIRVTLASVCSFDSEYGAFREACLTGRIFNRPNRIGPRSSGNPILLVWKAPQWLGLVTGENNNIRELLWPDRDKSEIERWKLSLRAIAFSQPANASEQSTPLRELDTDIIVLWNKAGNQFSIEKLAEPPPGDPAAFPVNGTDGVSRAIVRYILRGQDQLLAYTTTREKLPGTRFLVVRMHPDREPQSLETPDRDAANAKWNDWYQEWKRKGFGGASGNGLDCAPPY
jgi:hypothetical protein